MLVAKQLKLEYHNSLERFVKPSTHCPATHTTETPEENCDCAATNAPALVKRKRSAVAALEEKSNMVPTGRHSKRKGDDEGGGGRK